jgi:hypothetical protein
MNEDMNYKAAALLNRAVMAEVWRKLSEGLPVDESEEILAEQMIEHEEYHQLWDNIEQVGEYCFDPQREENPFLHVSVHVGVEQQIRSGEPACVAEAVERLVERGGNPHEARHAIARVLVEHIARILREKQPFDKQKYCEEIRKL